MAKGNIHLVKGGKIFIFFTKNRFENIISQSGFICIIQKT